MLLVPCPWCGKRAESEFFLCRSGTSAARTKLWTQDDEWIRYLFYKENIRGELEENWWHEKGCGEWFTLFRDTVTHQFIDKE